MSPVAIPESAIFERLTFSPQMAEALTTLAFSPEDQNRMRELMDRSNQGVLTDSERNEIEVFRRAGTLLGILQARARIELSKSSAAE
jgi:hypothetical protein